MINFHAHTDISNVRLLDSLNKTEDLIYESIKLGHIGTAITDHEAVGNHIKAIQTVKEGKKSGKIPEDYKLVLGNEIYLVESREEVRDNYVKGVTKYPHFLILAKNSKGHEAIRRLSSIAWEESYMQNGMRRVPTEYKDLEWAVKEYPDSLVMSSACFPQGTHVKTKNGLKKIEEIVSGEEVLTHKNRWKKVINPTTRYYEGDFVTIDTSHGGRKTVSTANHKYLTLGKKKKDELNIDRFNTIIESLDNVTNDKKTRLKQLCYNYELDWVEAKDLKKTSYTLQPLNEIEEDIKYFDLRKYNKPTNKYQLPDRIEVDDMFLRFIGMFISEGCFGFDKFGFCSGINFTLNIRDKHLLDDIVPVINKLGLHAYVSFREENKRVDVSTSSLAFGEFMYDLFGNKKGALNKHIPQVFKNLPKERLLPLIKGLFVTDGYARKRNQKGTTTYEVNFTTISPTLADDVVEISQKLNMNPSICVAEAKVDKNGVNHQEAYYLYYAAKKAKKLMDFIWEDKDFLYDCNDMNYIDYYIESNGIKYFRKKVKKIEKFYDKRQVFCLNVEEDHSFVAHNHIVHNCLGSPTSQYIINDDYEKAEQFIEWCIDLVGKDDFYLELQPNQTDEQKKVNKKLLEYKDKYGLQIIVTCDAHYLRPELREIHSAFLNSKDGDRETDLFYADTYLHTEEEIYQKMDYLSEEVVREAIETTVKMREKFEDYDLHNDTDIPRIKPDEFELNHLFSKAYDKFPSIEACAYSEEEQDRYLLYLIEEGFKEKEPISTLTKEYFYKAMDRIDKELYEILEISKVLNQTMSSYYVTMKHIIDIIWSSDECGGDSLVGGRGSVGAFYTAYLMSITEFNPLTCGIEIPHWRHLSAKRPEVGDIDLDSCATRRSKILNALKKHFGEDRVLSVCTYGTETSKSALKTSMRGLGYNSDDAAYMGSLIEQSRGSMRTLKNSLSGDDGEPINTQLKNEMEKYPKLIETALSIESLINKSSSHAGGICIYNEPYWKTNALMRSPKGTKTTQFSLHDSEYCGNIKYDILTTEAMDKMLETINLLIEYNEIEWKGDLRTTFNHYFHPSVLEYEDEEMYKKLANGSLPDMFQFTSDLGVSILNKVKPKTLVEVSAASNLMRLQAESGQEQPVDTFARYREDINLWYQEMEEYGLNKEEQELMKKHLLPLNGVCDSQESLMLLVMDKEVADFDEAWANKLRKAIAKKDPKSMEEAQNHFFKHCKEIGTSDALRDYVWNVQVYRQAGYSFPAAHSLQYATVLFQELNMGHKFPSVYWQTSCLNMNSGSVEVEEGAKGGKLDYGKISTAVSKLKKMGINIALPSVNTSKYSFSPDPKNNSIIYGLKPIKSINENIAYEIINNRPYSSFEDVLTKLYDTKIITTKHLISLIKSGACDEFGDRKQIMMEAIKYITPLKESLTLASVSKILEADLLEGREELSIILLRESFKNKVLRKEKSGNSKTAHKIFKVEKMEEYNKYFGEEAVVGVTENYFEVDEKQFKKVFDKKTTELKDWLKSDEAVDKLNRYELNQSWIKHALGSYSKWEMETLNYYHHEHELANIDDEEYNTVRFKGLLSEPTIRKYNKWKDREIPVFDTFNVVGTVLGVDKTRHTVSMLDVDGTVFAVKYQAGQFANYNKVISKTVNGKKETISKSWLSRGNHLMIHGFRRGGQFVAKKYADSPTTTTTKLIESISDDGLLAYRIEREY